MNVRDHTEYEQEVGAYLLGALTDLERQAFERHLAGCPRCQQEVEDLRLAVEALPRSVPQLEPAPRLKRSLMQTVEREAAERAGAAARPPLRQRLAARLPRLPAMRPAVAWASAAVVLGVGVATGFALSGALSGDDTRTVAATVDRARLPSAGGSLAVEDDGEDGAILRVNGMPSLRKERVYQAWVQREGRVVPQPTFEVGPDGSGAVAVPADLSDAKAVLVTREKRGGARAPSETPVMRVRLG
jgi:anti-sigma-K factor RskA